MRRWTIKELTELDDLIFANAILNERADQLNPNAPLAQKLRSAIRTISDVQSGQLPPKPEAPKKTYKTVEEAIEALDWTMNYCDDGSIELEKYSPAGEDFIFCVDKDNILDGVRRYAADFDVDEHVAMWIDGRGKNGVPATARELVEDAEAIQEMLDELVEALENVKAD